MVELEFDPAKDAINRDKHGIGLAAAAIILGTAHVRQRSAVRTKSGEERWLAIGRIEGPDSGLRLHRSSGRLPDH